MQTTLSTDCETELMIKLQKIIQLREHGITSLELLLVLLATDREIRINDLCAITTVKRRTLELMVKSKPQLLQRKTRYETPTGITGAPQSKVIIRTHHATQILTEIFE